MRSCFPFVCGNRPRSHSLAGSAHLHCEPLEDRLVLSSLTRALGPCSSDPRSVSSLDASWKFIRTNVPGAQQIDFDDSAWSTVDVPHTWNNLDGQDGGNNYYRGIGWYRKHVTIAPDQAGK